jgi:hypothetical protein
MAAIEKVGEGKGEGEKDARFNEESRTSVSFAHSPTGTTHCRLSASRPAVTVPELAIGRNNDKRLIKG